MVKESEEKVNVGGLNASEIVVALLCHQDIDTYIIHLDRAMAKNILVEHNPAHVDAYIILVYLD